jgi:hypothetical protein
MKLDRWHQYRGKWKKAETGRWVRAEDVEELEDQFEQLRIDRDAALAKADHWAAQTAVYLAEIERLRDAVAYLRVHLSEFERRVTW